MNHQPMKIALIFSMLVISIIAALSFKRAPEKEKKPTSSPRIIVNKPPVEASAFDERLSRLTGKIENAPVAEPTESAHTPVNLDAPPPKLPEEFAAVTELEARPLAPLDPSELPLEETAEGLIHRVRDGDTLENLAQRFLGDASRAPEILAANRDKITNADLLPIGAELVMPPKEKVESAPEAAEDDDLEDEDLVPVAPAVKPHA